MKLRARLLLFSTAQLLVFGALFALAYGAFERSILPMFESLLSSKTERVGRMVSGGGGGPPPRAGARAGAAGVGLAARGPDEARGGARRVAGGVALAWVTALISAILFA